MKNSLVAQVAPVALPQVDEAQRLIESVFTTDVDTPSCYVCGGTHKLNDCHNCERVICETHTTGQERTCGWTATWCPVCWGKKQRGQL